jgi:hypothetical protein
MPAFGANNAALTVPTANVKDGLYMKKAMAICVPTANMVPKSGREENQKYGVYVSLTQSFPPLFSGGTSTLQCIKGICHYDANYTTLYVLKLLSAFII